MDTMKKQGGRAKKHGWGRYTGTISGEVMDAIQLIATLQKRDAGEVVDEYLRKAGVLELLDTLMQERLAEQTEKGQRKHFDEMLGTSQEYHRIFAECVFEELERTHQLCRFETLLKTRGYSPEYGEVDNWRYWKKIPFEFHKGIHLMLGRTGWDARLETFTKTMSNAQERGVTPLATGTTGSSIF